jgi:hypothetical protein
MSAGARRTRQPGIQGAAIVRMVARALCTMSR